MKNLSRRTAIHATGAAVAGGVLPAEATEPLTAEAPVTRVYRLGGELAEAMSDWMDALGIDGKPDLWKAHVYPASFIQYPVCFEHIGWPASAHAGTLTEIEKLFVEWQAVRNRPWETETEEESEAGYAEYRRLQIAIVESGLEPTSVRDMALQYVVDTDCLSSECSEHWKNIVSRLLGESIEGVA